jgi:cystathionine beta-lyase
MSQRQGLDRRAFLRNAGLTALAGAVAGPASAGQLGAGVALAAATPDTFNFDEVYDRVGTDCTKWDAAMARFGRENIQVGMGIADQDFRVAPAITRALRERIGHENYGYLTIPSSYVDSIVNWNKRRYGLDINPDLLLHSDGVHQAIISTLRAFCPPGSKVLVQSPVYNGFFTDIRVVDCRIEESPMVLDRGRFAMDFDDLERRIDHDTHAFILCNPHNPTGNVWSREDLQRVGEICARRRVVVLADEIHCDFVTKGNKYTPFATLKDEAIVKNSITYKSTSKSFSLSSMKSAYMFSTNPDYIARIRQAGQHRPNTNTLGMVASQAAYNEAEPWLDQAIAYIDGTMDYVASVVGTTLPYVKFVKPQGTYLTWIDVSELIDRIGAKKIAAAPRQDGAQAQTPEQVLERWLVEHAKVHMNPGSSYGVGGAGRMRMNVAAPRKLVALALNNMAQAARRV